MRYLKWIIDVLLWVYLSTLLMVMLPFFCGFQIYAVVSGSMHPNIPTGSAVFVKTVPFEEITPGEVITYRHSDQVLVTHRVIEIQEKEKRILTRGDANECVDAQPVCFEQVLGKVFFSLPYLGRIAVLFQGVAEKIGLLLMLFWLFLMQTILAWTIKKKEGAAE